MSEKKEYPETVYVNHFTPEPEDGEDLPDSFMIVDDDAKKFATIDEVQIVAVYKLSHIIEVSCAVSTSRVISERH